MKIRNNDSKFEITYDAKQYMIPTGDMEIADEGFATHIMNKARAWGFSVEKIGDSSDEAVQPIEAITEETTEDEVDETKKKEEVKEEETTKEDTKKTTKKTK
jgi:hypothetical protein